MIKGFLLFFLILNSLCHAQTGGEATFLILNTTTSARQTALGGKVLTLTDNVNQPTWNPATINLDLDKRLSANYTSYIGGISMGSVSYAHRFNRRSKTFHTNIKYINYGSFIQANDTGEETGTFNASDIILSFGYAYHIPNSDFHIGANIKYIHSNIANYSASGIAADFGILYYSKDKPYRLTFVARNLGTQLSTYNGTQEKLPFEIAIGGSYQLEKVPLRWYATIDNIQKWNIAVANPSNQTTDLEGNVTKESISFVDNAFRHISMGAELFSERAINLRLGYNFRRGAELQIQDVRSFGGLSFGFGLRMNAITLNYAYSRYHLASNTSTFSLEINLNKNTRK